MSLKKSLLEKKVAWNGIALDIPDKWEVDSLDTAYMMIGDQGRPKVEIQWIEAPKKFTLANYLKRFVTQSQKRLEIKIHEEPTPHSFSHPQKAFEFFFFSWESIRAAGNGTLIFCHHCKRLTMVRFFSKKPDIAISIQESVIDSIHDHPETDHLLWQIFGLEFLTPASFKLMDYSLKPGAYALSFKHKKTILKIFSWGPAKFLLADTTLPEFAQQRLPQVKGLSTSGFSSRGSYLEWRFRTHRLKNIETIPLLNKLAMFTLLRMCHDTENNRIFGVLVDSPTAYETGIMKRSIIDDI